MSDVNTQISLLQVEFSMHSSSLIGCMSCVKTRLASFGVGQVCSPYSSQLSCYSFVIIRISILLEHINENDHFVRKVVTVFMENRYVGVWARKYKRIDVTHASTLLRYLSKVLKRFIQLAKVIIELIFCKDKFSWSSYTRISQLTQFILQNEMQLR
jgi:hypothetical protein